MVLFFSRFRKLRKATITFVTSVRLFVLFRMEQYGSDWTYFIKFDLSILRKSVENIRLIKIGEEWRVRYMKTTRYLRSYLDQFFLEWEMFQTKL